MFRANYDQNSVVTHELRVPLIARAIRIKPLTWHAHITIRLEAYISDLTASDEYVPESTIWVPAVDSGHLVTASSEWTPAHSVYRASLHFNQFHEKSGAWQPAGADVNQWIQVSRQILRKGVKSSTQGSCLLYTSPSPRDS